MNLIKIDFDKFNDEFNFNTIGDIVDKAIESIEKAPSKLTYIKISDVLELKNKLFNFNNPGVCFKYKNNTNDYFYIYLYKDNLSIEFDLDNLGMLNEVNISEFKSLVKQIIISIIIKLQNKIYE